MGRNGQPLAIFSQFRQGLALFVGKFKFHVLPRMTLRIRYRTLKTSRAVLGLAPAARGGAAHSFLVTGKPARVKDGPSGTAATGN